MAQVVGSLARSAIEWPDQLLDTLEWFDALNLDLMRLPSLACSVYACACVQGKRSFRCTLPPSLPGLITYLRCAVTPGMSFLQRLLGYLPHAYAFALRFKYDPCASQVCALPHHRGSDLSAAMDVGKNVQHQCNRAQHFHKLHAADAVRYA